MKFHPYVLIRRQKLKDGDPTQRLAFCNRFVNQVEQNPGFLDHLIVSDKAVFSLNSEINTRNVRKYALHGDGHSLDHYVEFLQGANQIMVWIGLTRQALFWVPISCKETLTAENVCESSAITSSREIFVFMASIRILYGGNKMGRLRMPAMQRSIPSWAISWPSYK